MGELHGSSRHIPAAADDVEGFQGIGTGIPCQRITGQRDEVVVVNELFLVPQFLETHEDRIGSGLAQIKAKLLKTHDHGVASAVFGQGQVGAAPTHIARIHDLVSLAFFEDSVLMNSGTVGEGVLSDDCLASGDLQAAEAADHARGLEDLPCRDPGRKPRENIGPCLDRHDHLLQGGIAGSLADAVEGSLDLTGTGLDGRKGIGNGHAQIVVAMDADDRFPDIPDMRAQIADQVGILPGHGIADRVRNVHRGCAGLDCCLDNFGQKLGLRARGILGRELDVGHHGLGLPHSLRRQPQDLLVCFAQLVLSVDLGGGQEDMDTGACSCRKKGESRRLDVLGHAARQTRDDGTGDFAGNRLHRLEVPVADHRETRLDDVDLEPRELARNLQFFLQVHGSPGTLLSVAQCRVKNQNSVGIHGGIQERKGRKTGPLQWMIRQEAGRLRQRGLRALRWGL